MELTFESSKEELKQQCLKAAMSAIPKGFRDKIKINEDNLDITAKLDEEGNFIALVTTVNIDQ